MTKKRCPLFSPRRLEHRAPYLQGVALDLHMAHTEHRAALKSIAKRTGANFYGPLTDDANARWLLTH